MKALTILSGTYPCNVGPTWQMFVRQVAHSLARQGVEVSVLSPLAVHRAWKGKDPVLVTEEAGGGRKVRVYRPRYLSFSNYRLGPWTSYSLTHRSFLRAARNVFAYGSLPQPSALYGHFLYPAGAAVVKLGCEFGVSSFPAVGEGKLNTISCVGKATARKDLAGATGFISNSSDLAKLLQTELGISARRIGVFPNGVDQTVFFPRDKKESRARFNLPADKFLVCCVARFDPDKGAQRVALAIDGLEDVGGVFAGWGSPRPQSANILLMDRLPHDEIPWLLSASDVFVLPTLYEGCCNAIVEAMTCGLPIISSSDAFNDDILRPGYSIRLHPLDIQGLKGAVCRLRDNPALCQSMAAESLKASKSFCIDARAKKILEFVESRLA